MSRLIRFVHLGDLHYVQPDVHQHAFAGHAKGCTELVDLKRNFWMTQNVTPRVLAAVAKQRPDFVVQTGDLIHGHCDDEAGALREMAEALELMNNVQVPVFYAQGTHDGIVGRRQDAPVRELLWPSMEDALGYVPDRGYFSFSRNGSLFVLLDYTTFTADSEQAEFIRSTIANSDRYDHVFVFAHPPLVPIGRPFFSSFSFSNALLTSVAEQPIDAYFCGHTHNQVASVHRVGGAWLPQLKGSSLAYPEEPPVFLEQVRPLLPDPASFEYGWGFLEDSAPGWWLVTIDGDRVVADWHVLDRGVEGQLTWSRREKPIFTRRPSFRPHSQVLPTLDRIRSVRLRAAGSGCRNRDAYRVTLNDHYIGSLPRLEYFDCRQFLYLEPEHWPLLQQQNTLQITTSNEEMGIGAFVLEIETHLGWVRSSLASEFYANTHRWDMWEVEPLRYIAPNETVAVALSFASDEDGDRHVS